jgi:hypothetical protein
MIRGGAAASGGASVELRRFDGRDRFTGTKQKKLKEDRSSAVQPNRISALA